MRRRLAIVGMVALALPLLAAGGGFVHKTRAPIGPTSPPTPRAAQNLLAGLPLAFEASSGRIGSSFDFVARSRGATVAVGATTARLVAGGSGRAIDMRLVGADAGGRAKGSERLRGVVNDFRGTADRWRRTIPTYGRVVVDEPYPGIDLAWYGAGDRLEYDFEVAPGADPSAIRLRMDGADGVEVTEDGSLELTAGQGRLRFDPPRTYQRRADGSHTAIGSSYRLEHRADGTADVTFEIAAYDRSRVLVIDPVLSYSTFFGGAFSELQAKGVGVLEDGDIWLAGETGSLLPFQDAQNDGFDEVLDDTDAFVARIDASGTALVFATYVGGNTLDRLRGAAAGSDGVYVGGLTFSSSGVATPGAHQPVPGSAVDAWLAKVSLDGSELLFATYLGGGEQDEGLDVYVDAHDRAYLTGFAGPTFPTTPNALPAPAGGAFVARFLPTGALDYSTFLGGERGTQVAASAAGDVFVAGSTTDVPVLGDDGTVGDNSAFVARIVPESQTIVARELAAGDLAVGADGRPVLGGVEKRTPDLATQVWAQDLMSGVSALTVDRLGDVHVVGTAKNTTVFHDAYAVFPDANLYAAKLRGNNGAVVYTTGIGGDDQSFAGDVAADECGNTYAAGIAKQFPSTPNSLYPTAKESDAFVARLHTAPRAFVPSMSATNSVVQVDTSGAKSGTTTAANTSVSPWIFGVAAHPDGRRVFMTDWDKEAVRVYDRAAKTTRVIPLSGYDEPVPSSGADPIGIAISKDGRRAYVANSGLQSVSVIDALDETLLTEISLPASNPAPGPFAVAVDPAGTRLYVTDRDGPMLSIVDLTDNTVQAVDMGGGMRGVAIHPDGKTVYVARTRPHGLPALAALDVTKSPPELKTVDLPKPPYGVAVHPNGHEVYVGASDSLYAVSADLSQVLLAEAAPLPSGMDLGARGVSVTPDGAHVAAAGSDGRVYFWRTNATHDYVKKVDVGPNPIALGSFITPPDDGDWIPPSLDVQPDVCSRDFSDVAVGGTAFGRILDRGHLIAAVRDLESGGMVLEAIGTSSDPVVYETCGTADVHVAAGGEAGLIECGSVRAEVRRPPVEFRFVNGAVRTAPPAGARIYAEKRPDGGIVIENAGGIPFEVVVRGQIQPMNGGARLEVTGAPDTTIHAGPPPFVAHQSAVFHFSSDVANAIFHCSLDEAPFSRCGSPHEMDGVLDGEHTFAVRATDSAGNADPSPARWSWVVDRSPPEVALLRPAGGLWAFDTHLGGAGAPPVVLGPVTVVASASDAQSGISSVGFFVDDDAVTSPVTHDPVAGTWSFTYAASSPGFHTITARAQNGSGLAVERDRTVVVLVP